MSEPRWADVAALNDLPVDDVICVAIAGRELALYNVAGEIYATDNECTHGQGRLCDGFLEGTEIECPLHQGRFDVRSGAPACAPVTEPVRTYTVKIDGGRVFVAMEE
jgi:naphthalene 1,2-dioxygenase ferredoxin component